MERPYNTQVSALHIVPKTFRRKTVLRKDGYNITILLKCTYQIGSISFNISWNLTTINLFKTHDDVKLRSYTVIRFDVCYSICIKRHRFPMQTIGTYTEFKHIILGCIFLYNYRHSRYVPITRCRCNCCVSYTEVDVKSPKDQTEKQWPLRTYNRMWHRVWPPGGKVFCRKGDKCVCRLSEGVWRRYRIKPALDSDTTWRHKGRWYKKCRQDDLQQVAPKFWYPIFITILHVFSNHLIKHVFDPFAFRN